MSRKVIETFLKKIDEGYYHIIDNRINKNGKPIGSKVASGYIYHTRVGGGDYAHRILFAYYHGIDKLYKYESVNHLDGDKENNSIENLEGASLKENTIHQWENNLGLRGSKCSYAILNEEKVRVIKSLLNENNLSQYKIATKYGVSRSCILDIKSGKSWKHVI